MKLPRIAIGAGAGLLAALLLAPMMGAALGKLSSARAEHARLTAIAADPAANPALLAPGLAIKAADIAAARAAMMQQVQTLAKAGGVLVEETGAAPAAEGLVALRIRLSGAEKAVLSLTDTLERTHPLMRLRRWRIEAIAGGGVRLSGDLLAAWQ